MPAVKRMYRHKRKISAVAAAAKIIALQTAVAVCLMAGLFTLQFVNEDEYKRITDRFLTDSREVFAGFEADRLWELKDEAVEAIKSFADKITAEKGRAPVENGRVVSGFGLRKNPFKWAPEIHGGVDIAAAEGESITPVFAGVVIKTGTDKNYGNYVSVRHSEGISLYCHCKTVEAETGDEVTEDTVIATVGSTGRATGSHLHLEFIKDGKRINPARVVEL